MYFELNEFIKYFFTTSFTKKKERKEKIFALLILENNSINPILSQLNDNSNDC